MCVSALMSCHEFLSSLFTHMGRAAAAAVAATAGWLLVVAGVVVCEANGQREEGY